MGARLRSWWQKIRQPLLVVGIIIACVLGIALVVGIIGGYVFNWNWTGLSQKTLWDWMQLLFIPVVLAAAGFWFNHRERKATELRADNEQKAAKIRAWNEHMSAKIRAEAERQIMLDNQREAALQAYINEMSELLLHENLRESQPDTEVRKIARVRTLTVLPRLDEERKRSVLRFLYEGFLIMTDKSIVSLGFADLSRANLSKLLLLLINLSGADLNEANLEEAVLDKAILTHTNLRDANLRDVLLNGADLSGAMLLGANLSGAIIDEANLNEAKVTPEQLAKAKSLKGATMPDGSIHP